jgi:hypothetical protein
MNYHSMTDCVVCAHMYASNAYLGLKCAVRHRVRHKSGLNSDNQVKAQVHKI